MPKKILIIGDKANDVFIYGSCVKISPEAPVIDFKPNDTGSKTPCTTNVGMAANVMQNLRSLAPLDWEVIGIFNKEEITKTRYIDEASKQHLLRVSNEPFVTPLTIQDLDEYKDDKDLIGIVLSDYAKGSITEKFVIELCENFLNTPIFLDTKKALNDWSQDIDFVKINAKEYELTKKSAYSCVNLIVTQGSQGSWWVNQDYRCPTEPVELADFCGAGDTYLAAFVIKYLETLDVKTAMKYANAAARVAVSKRGVAVVEKSEISP